MAVKFYVVPENDSLMAKVKAWVHNRNVDLKCAWDENPAETAAIFTTFVGAVGVIAKAVGKQANIRKEERLKDLRVWDPVLGIQWQLRKKMSQDQQLEFETRRKSGEACGSILRSMRLI